MEKRDFYLYINGQPVPVSEEVYREYYRAEDKERYFMGRLKKGHTKVNPETKEIRYIPSRELSYEQLVEQDWQFAATGDSVEDRVVRADLIEKLRAVLHSLSTEEMALLEELFYLEKTEREVAGLYAVSQNTIHYRKTGFWTLCQDSCDFCRCIKGNQPVLYIIQGEPQMFER